MDGWELQLCACIDGWEGTPCKCMGGCQLFLYTVYKTRLYLYKIFDFYYITTSSGVYESYFSRYMLWGDVPLGSFEL